MSASFLLKFVQELSPYITPRFVVKMGFAMKVFKKTSPNGKVTVYLGKREFVDNLASVEPIDGVIVVEDDYLKNRRIFGQVICCFRYGREADEVMGLEFQKELLMDSGEIGPASKKASLSKMQERLLQKLGDNAYPFTFHLPKNSPPSVTVQPNSDVQGKPCGVDYTLKVFVGENVEDRAHKRSTVALGIRVIQYAPRQHGKQPCTVVRRDFVLSPGELEVELTLDKQIYNHGEPIQLHVAIQNRSNKTVKKVRAQIQQCVDICLFEHGSYKTAVANLDSTDGCPIQPGGTLHRTMSLTPDFSQTSLEKHGVAMDGALKTDKPGLASTTLMANPDDRDAFGIVVTYYAKVRLFLGALAGEVVAELPFIMMHPKPTPKKLVAMDSVAVETFAGEELGEDVSRMKLDAVDDEN